MARLTRRAALLGGGAAMGAVATGLSVARLPKASGALPAAQTAPVPFLNDASGLSPTPVHKHITLTQDPGSAIVDALRSEFRTARAEGRPVNIGAARHSMGGQAIPRSGHAVTFDNALVQADIANGTARVHAGARWSQVIAALDPMGWGPKVMQSNHDFGVAATFCVNAHGWPVRLGPMGTTVRAFDIVLADGSEQRVTRDSDPVLFGMTMGGYGLTGALTAIEMEIAPNRRLIPTFAEMPAGDFADAFVAALSTGQVNMAYGRLNVDRDRFFQDALMITYQEDADQSDLPPASGSGWVSHAASYLYRAQLGREGVKRLRWWTETKLGPAIGSGAVTRNSLINEPVITLDDRDPLRTDILHEYFVSPARFGDFLDLCRRVIPSSYQSFLNVTLRFVDSDPDSWLAYAPVPRIAAVMSFSQELTTRAEADMARMTRDLIEGVIAIGGTYYLPYRPHATLDQFTRAYPRAMEFARRKRELDPDALFGSVFWDRYLGAL